MAIQKLYRKESEALSVPHSLQPAGEKPEAGLPRKLAEIPTAIKFSQLHLQNVYVLHHMGAFGKLVTGK